MAEVEKMVDLLTQAREAYYGQGSSLMSDEEFDELEESLKKLDPGNNYFSTLGISSDDTGSEKIKHTIPMLSMGKAKTPEEVMKWMDRLALEGEIGFCIQPKIDGLGATCLYREGQLVYTATRGDGTIGQDISHVIPYIDDIISSVSFSKGEVEIRGELYLPKNTDYDTGGRPLRNNCVGLINRKENRNDLHHVRFVCYQIVSSDPSLLPARESEKIELLKKEGFNTVDFYQIDGQDRLNDIYSDYLGIKRDKWLYETDGLIITVDQSNLHDEIDSRWIVDHHHHYAIALKPPAAGKETTLTGIEWQISRQGNLIPVARFKSIELGGANLERASLHNAQFVRDLMLLPGDRLIIERANDVIPYVRSNLSFEGRSRESFIDPLIPRKCPVCSSALEDRGVHLHCTNKSCPERQIQSILYWVRQSDMEQIAEGTIRQLYKENRVKSIKDLYTMKEADFINLEGFGDKKITNFLKQTREKKLMTSLELLSKLGIPLVQKKALIKLGINSLEDFYTFSDNSYIIGQNIIAWRDDRENREFLDELLEVLEIEETSPVTEKREICFTGSGPLNRKELIRIAEDKGFTVGSSVTKSTEILVCEDPGGSSSKLQKAREQNINLISYADFMAL
jgi:DNA ligase (NAD+)